MMYTALALEITVFQTVHIFRVILTEFLLKLA